MEKITWKSMATVSCLVPHVLQNIFRAQLKKRKKPLQVWNNSRMIKLQVSFFGWTILLRMWNMILGCINCIFCMQIGVLLSNAMTFMQCLIVSYTRSICILWATASTCQKYLSQALEWRTSVRQFVLISYYLKVLFKDMGLDVSLLCYIWNETIGAHFMYFDFT